MVLASVNLVLVMVAMVIVGSDRSRGGDGGICNDNNNYPTLPSFFGFPDLVGFVFFSISRNSAL